MDIVYACFESRVQTKEAFVCVSDVAEIVCSDKEKEKQIKELRIHEFGAANRNIVTALHVVGFLEKKLENIVVVPLGAEDIILERIPQKEPSRVFEVLKVVFASLVSFFGTAFTIMAFHNDIGIRNVFLQISSIITGERGNGVMVLELAYAVGLASGILIFFNHIGKRRITNDPTPVEVSMRNYEDDVNKTLAETFSREGKTIEAD